MPPLRVRSKTPPATLTDTTVTSCRATGTPSSTGRSCVRNSRTQSKAHEALIDGEIVCLDARGRSNFKSLLFRREWPYFYAFDLLAMDGRTCASGRWWSGSDGCAD